MSKIDKIKELIPLLDEHKDFALIMVLKQELSREKIKHLSIHSVTPKEEERAKYGLRRTLNTFLNNEDSYSKRISRIIEKYNCDSCKYSVKKEYNSISFDFRNEDCDVCVSCYNRADRLQDILDERENENKRSINHAINNNKNLIECKAIINKINYKLKNKNYATS